MFKLLPSQLPASLILSPSSCPCLSRSSSQKSFLSVFSHSHLWKQGSSLNPRSKGAQSREGKIYKSTNCHLYFPFSFRLSSKTKYPASSSQFSCTSASFPTPPKLDGCMRCFKIVVDRKKPFHTLSSHTKLTKDIVLLMTSSRGRFNS